MRPSAPRLRIALALACLWSFGGCQRLLPERFAVNAPIGNSLFGCSSGAPAAELFGSRIRVPDGFSIGLYAQVPRARFLRPTPAGDLLVSVPRAGEVWLLERDGDGDGLPDGQRALLSGLDRPHGIDLYEDWLYVAEGDAVGRIRFDVETGATLGELERVVGDLPSGGNHWTRTLRFGPDGWMYVSVGSSCNACFEEDERRAAMLRFRPDGSDAQIYARGLRNAVGFDWHPASQELYATDNGRDLLGDDFPPCELNRVVEGADYGWPVANGDRVIDPDLGEGFEQRVMASQPPAFSFAAHNAPLGITFLRGESLGAGYRNAALVALHGSWNRTRKDGYKVVSLHWNADGRIVQQDFVWGFLLDEDVVGRPVDVAQAPDGSVFVSDDYAGAVYRITRGSQAASAPRSGDMQRADPLATLSASERDTASQRGHALYERFSCAGCHESGRATAGVVPVALEDLAARHDLASVEALLETPTPPMPLFDMSAPQRRDLAVYLLSRFEASSQLP